MSNARVSQQYIEILAQNPSKARVSQQYIELLTANSSGTDIEKTVNSTLNLSDSYLFEYETSVTDSLNISDSNTVEKINPASSSINLSQGLNFELETSITDTLGIADATQKDVPFNYHSISSLELSTNVSHQKERSFSASSTINLTDSIVALYEFNISSTINIGQSAVVEQVRGGIPMGSVMTLTDQALFDLGTKRFPGTDLNLTDNVEIRYPYRGTVGHYIRFDSDVFVQHAVQNYSVETELDLRSGTPIEPSFTDTLNLTDEAVRRWWPITNLGLTHNVIGAKAKNASNELGLQQTISANFTFNRSLTSEIENLSALTFYTPNKSCVLREYNPFCGEDATNPFRLTIKPLQRDASSNRVVLAWPNIEYPLNQIVLRAPEIDDISRYTCTRSYKETRGGSISVYANEIWPKIQTLVVTFIGLSATEADAFQDFVYETMGKEINLGDWNGYIWRGLITNPEEPVIEDGRRGYTVSFQFEGEKRGDSASVQSVALTESTDYEIAKWILDTVNITDEVTVTRDLARSAISYVTIISDRYDLTLDEESSSTVNLSEEIEVLRVRLVDNDANITDEVSTIIDHGRSINQDLNMASDPSTIIDRGPESTSTANILDETNITLDAVRSVSDTIDLSDEVTSLLHPMLIEQLGIEQELILTVYQIPT